MADGRTGAFRALKGECGACCVGCMGCSCLLGSGLNLSLERSGYLAIAYALVGRTRLLVYQVHSSDKELVPNCRFAPLPHLVHLEVRFKP